MLLKRTPPCAFQFLLEAAWPEMVDAEDKIRESTHAMYVYVTVDTGRR